MAVARSEEIQLVAYALSRCGSADERGRSKPPAWLGTDTWANAYDQFFEKLGDGRSAQTFRNTLKNARDAFDAHTSSNRIGWVDPSGKPFRADRGLQKVLDEWTHRPDDELEDAVLSIRELGHFSEGEEEAAPEGERRTEGGRRLHISWKIERSRSAREGALRLHGHICMGCGFDFELRYGQYGRGLAEVHHAMPLAEFGKRKTDASKDLVVLCANCHRVVHRKRGICLSLAELKQSLI